MKFRQTTIASLILIFILPTFAFSQDNYTFERMWPTLQQPWYFSAPKDVAADRDGYIYISDTRSHSVQKFTRDGQFVAKWKVEAREDGNIPDIAGIAVDDKGFVYVTDSYGVQKFDSDGQFEQKWLYDDKGGSRGYASRIPGIAVDNEDFVYVFIPENREILKFTTDGRLAEEGWHIRGDADEDFHDGLYSDIAVDNRGFLYVADTERSRIQKFDTNGEFQSRWTVESGGEDGTTAALPVGIAVDQAGFVYVTDDANGRILKYDSDGVPVSDWRINNSGQEYFHSLAGLSVSPEGFVYIADWNYHCIHKLASDTGNFIVKWSSFGGADGEFNRPVGVAIDEKNKYLYVSDGANNRIQKFAVEGRFEGKWDKWENSDGKKDGFDLPYGIAVDSQGLVYVADSNNDRILKFDSDGNLAEWGKPDIGQAEFDGPSDVAIDENDAIYVADTQNDLVWKFNPDGSFNQKWEEFETTFSQPSGVAVYKGIIYVADTGKSRIQKLDTDGNTGMWGQFGFGGDGVFATLLGITVDSNGFVYVSDAGGPVPSAHRVQKFDPEGNFIMEFGEFGSGLGQLNSSGYLCADADGNVYVADTLNNRIQVFRPADSQAKTDKAIIIAGGGSYEGNHLWDATRMAASYAFRVLNYRGFSKENIHYLSEDTELDLDGDGEPDVDREASTKALREVVEELESENNTKDMVIYLVDHGGEESFRMSGTETLSAEELAALTDRLQKSISGTLILVYDACESGSFHSELSPSSGESRILITSTKQNESAYFIAQGSVSFSQFFWTHIFDGKNVADAFSDAKKAIKRASDMKQRPNMPEICEELAKKTVIGNDSKMDWEGPDIESADSQVHGDSVTVSAVVKDDDAVDHVWATIAPVSREGEILLDKAVLELPSFDMKYDEENDRCEGRYDRLNADTDYQIVIHARDSIGNTSQRKLPDDLDTGGLPTRKIIIISGASYTGLRSFMEENIRLVENALKLQSYSGTIQHLDKPEMKELEDAFVSANNADTRELVLYMVGKGDWQRFHINDELSLSAVEFDRKLDQVQEVMPGMVTVIYDADYSGSFIPLLTPPEGRDRIVLTATSQTQKSLVSSDTAVSFSMFFWQAVSAGMNVRDAFYNAGNALSPFAFGKNRVVPQMDDNGDGRPNQRSDGQIAVNHTIGAGIKLLNDPAIADGNSFVELGEGEKSYKTTVNVISTIEEDDVWAALIPPQGRSLPESPQLSVLKTDHKTYDINCLDCFGDFGTYEIVIYAKNTEGEVSVCKRISIYQPLGPDAYEKDDTLEDAKFILTDISQEHNFYGNDKTDWLKFQGFSGEKYEIEANPKFGEFDVEIKILKNDGTSALGGEWVPGKKSWSCSEDGIYHLKLRQKELSGSQDTGYNVKVYIPDAVSYFPIIVCFVKDSYGNPIQNPEFKINGEEIDSIFFNGHYRIPFPYEEGTIAVEIEGYEVPKPKEIIVENFLDDIPVNFDLKPIYPYHSADINKDEVLDFSELLRVMQLFAAGAYSCDPGGEDGYAPGQDDDRVSCDPHDSDYISEGTGRHDWKIELSELLRLIQFYSNPDGYNVAPNTEDGFAPGKRQ